MSESSLAYLLQQALNAAPTAALYALLAFGYCLSFGLTRRADFTAGALFAFAGQIFVFFTAFGYDAFRLIYPLALGIGAGCSVLHAAGILGHRAWGDRAAVAPRPQFGDRRFAGRDDRADGTGADRRR